MNDKSTKPRLVKRVGNWIHHHRTETYLLGGAALIIITSAVALAILLQKPPESPRASYPKPKAQPKPVVYYSPLTGLPVASKAATTQAVTAIMIENSPDARPQSGLKQAGVVFEAIAEGGITRFLTLHQQDKPQLIGPVRSLRMYYVDWLAPFNASVAHVGGSYAALKEIRTSKYRDIDQFFNGSYYWRAADRYAPHNVYTSFAKLDALNKAKGYTSSTFTGFARTDEKPSTKPSATRVTINFNNYASLYNTSYTYDKKSNSYLRYLAGQPHLDREKGQINPKVVIALKVDETTVLEDGYRESINAIGSGSAIIFQNGTATQAIWHKASRGKQLTFTSAGKEIPLVRGQTWIAAVPNGKGNVTWQ